MTEAIGEDPGAIQQARASGGFFAVAAGLGVFGLATYGYLGFAGRDLGSVGFAPLSVLWTLLNAFGIGLFLPFEQELGRRTAERRATGDGNAPVVRRALAGAGITLGAVAVLAALGAGILSNRLFGGRVEMVPLFVLAIAGMAASYVVRGLLSGNGRFHRYGAQLAVDGVLRLGGAALLYFAGVSSVLAYGSLLVITPVLSVLLTTPRPSSIVTPGPPHAARVAAVGLGALIAASLLSQILANAGPIMVELLATADEAEASGQFVAALVIARVPLFVFAAVQAVLLPGLAASVGARDAATFRARMAQVGLATLVIGVVGTLAVWFLGPQLVPLLFSDAFGTDRGVITLIAGSGAVFMLAQAAAQGLLALGAERFVVVGWSSGLAALTLALAWDGPIAERAAVALLAGSAGAMAVLAAGLLSTYRRWVEGALAAPVA